MAPSKHGRQPSTSAAQPSLSKFFQKIDSPTKSPPKTSTSAAILVNSSDDEISTRPTKRVKTESALSKSNAPLPDFSQFAYQPSSKRQARSPSSDLPSPSKFFAAKPTADVMEIDSASDEDTPAPAPAPAQKEPVVKPTAKAKGKQKAIEKPAKKSAPKKAPATKKASKKKTVTSDDEESQNDEDDETPAPKGKKGKLTPLEEQVKAIKKKNPDTVLLVEVGYKYRFFENDALIARDHLHVAAYPVKNMMSAMIPAGREHIHIKTLLAAGYKVGLVQQVETAALKKVGDNRNAPFERKLTKLYTSATYIDGLDEDLAGNTGRRAQGCLMALVEEAKGKGTDEKVSFGMVAVVPSSGEVIYDEWDDGFLRAELETRILHLAPNEIILPVDGLTSPSQKLIDYYSTQDTRMGNVKGRVEHCKHKITQNTATSTITDFYSNISGDQTEESPNPLKTALNLSSRIQLALVALLQHLKLYGLEAALDDPSIFRSFAQRGHMTLSANTLQHLEIFNNQTDFSTKSSLFSLLDNTKTPFGRRLLKSWVAKPLLDRGPLEERANTVDEIVESNAYILGKLRGLLSGLPDLERGLSRCHYGKTTAPEFAKILSAFQRVGDEFQATFSDPNLVGFRSNILNEAVASLPAVKPIIAEIIAQVNMQAARDNKLADMFKDPALYPEIEDYKDVEASISFEFHEHLLAARKILKKPALQYVEVADEKYLVEVRRPPSREKDLVPDDWVRINSTKTVWRYRSKAMQDTLAERERAVESKTLAAEEGFKDFVKKFCENISFYRTIIRHLATLDALFSLAQVALLPGYVRPTISTTSQLEIVEGRHPMIEQILNDPYVPNSVAFTERSGMRAMVLSGCNMAGKSATSKMCALLSIMAQIGSRVPADRMTLGLFDAVHTRFGAADDMARGRSTFMCEMSEASEILKMATPRSLLILDELGRGTSTSDGVSIAWAVLSHLANLNPITLFVTHYPQISKVAEEHPGIVQLWQMDYMEEDRDGIPEITFLYKLKRGFTDKSHGVNVARMAGLPQAVCENALAQSTLVEKRAADLMLVRRCLPLLKQITSGDKAKIEELSSLVDD